MKNFSPILMIISILFLFFLPGCGGSNTVTSVITTPTPVPSQSVISTAKEIGTKVSNVSFVNGGEISFGDLNVIISAGALSSDNEIEIAEVNITDRNGILHSSSEEEHGKIYEVSSGSPDELIGLNKPVELEIKVDPNSPAPGLAIWSGEEWLLLDEEFTSYDSNTHTLKTCIDFIAQDLDNYVIEGNRGSIMTHPVNVTYFKNINYGWGLNYNYPNYEYSSKGNFTIHYSNNISKEEVKSMGDFFEACYSYYKELGYASPVSFSYSKENQVYGSKRIMVYTKQNSELGAWASNCGIIYMPSAKNKFISETGYHELFHLVQNNYSKRCGFLTWMAENTAESMGPYAYNQLDTTEKNKYDIPAYNGSEGGFWIGADLFSVSLDNQEEKSGNEYYNAVIWTYLIAKYGMNSYKNIVSDFFSKNSNTPFDDLDYSFKHNINKYLSEFYAETLEDYFVYGQIFNKLNYVNFPYREKGDPFCSQTSGYSNYYNYNAFSSDFDLNPYYNQQKFTLYHLSGRYFNFKSNGNKGSLYLTVTPSITDYFVVKVYRFKNTEGKFALLDVQEYGRMDSQEVIYNDATDITVLLENLSYYNDNNINLRAYGR
jgi:hypothetical protein